MPRPRLRENVLHPWENSPRAAVSFSRLYGDRGFAFLLSLGTVSVIAVSDITR